MHPVSRVLDDILGGGVTGNDVPAHDGRDGGYGREKPKLPVQKDRTGASEGLFIIEFLDPKKPPTTCGRLEVWKKSNRMSITGRT